MKKKKPIGIEESRRRFMAYFSSVGLSTTLVPGILWGRMQDAGAQQITLAMLTDALKLGGVEFSEDERQQMVDAANQNLTRAKAIQAFHIPNDVSPPFHINAIVPGVVVKKTPEPFALSKVAPVKVPGNLEDVAYWPVRHLHELIRTKQVSSVELTRMYLERLHKYNGQLLNTVTFLDELAMEQAKAADTALAAGKMKSPLQGIPWGCKDIITVKGYKTTWGSGAYKDQSFDYDASIVEMLRESGAVLIAKLVSGELAQGANWFGGTTKNPWNYGSSSGSSAGPGSATAAGCVGFAIGTETQGSILSPSGTNGLAGLRPTFGRISRHGAMTLGWTYDRLGPMCRYAEDCAMVMSVIAKPDGRDMSVSDIPFNWNPARYDLKKIKIGVTGMDGNVSPAAKKFMDTMKGLGATFTPLTIPPDNLPPFQELFNYEQGAFFDELVRSGGVEKMTNPGRGAGFKTARLMNVVDFLQMSRIRMMMMMNLAKATAGFDAYFSAAAGGQRGGGGGARGGGRGAAAAGATAADAPAAGPRGGGGGGAGSTGNTNSAGYPGLNVVTQFSDPTSEAPVGTPESIVLYGPPFKETEILFVGKSFQDVVQLWNHK